VVIDVVIVETVVEAVYTTVGKCFCVYTKVLVRTPVTPGLLALSFSVTGDFSLMVARGTEKLNVMVPVNAASIEVGPPMAATLEVVPFKSTY